LTLEAYGDNRWIIARERPSADEIESSVDRLLQTSGVSAGEADDLELK